MLYNRASNGVQKPAVDTLHQSMRSAQTARRPSLRKITKRTLD
jgi:hypothetical protein